jgi:hypothetical protein
MDESRNPCDLCQKVCHETECALNCFTREYQCEQLKCFLNYEGSCMISLYDNCGAWEGK